MSAKTMQIKVVVMPLNCMAFLPAISGAPAGLPGFEMVMPTEDLIRDYLFHQSTTDDERLKLDPHFKEFREEESRLSSEVQSELNRRRQQYQRILQVEINRRLGEILRGTDARSVFKLHAKQKRGPQTDARNQAMVLEVLRLHHLEGVPEPRAKTAVSEAFAGVMDKEDIGIRTVEKALQKWRDHPWFAVDRLKLYAQVLRMHRYID
jgi:hypothetical protein